MLAINHTGWLDFTFAGLAAHPSGRLVRFMAKESIFANPVAGPLMRGMKHIPVDREAGAAAYRAAVTALRQGELIGVFPETTISRSFELLPFKSGSVRMAVSGKVPILPIVIWGSQRVWTAGIAEPSHRTASPSASTCSLRSRWLEVTTPRWPPRCCDHDGARAARCTGPIPGTPQDAEDAWWLPARLGGAAPTPEEGLALLRAKDQKARARPAAVRPCPPRTPST